MAEYSVSFRIMHKNLEPLEVSKLLKLKPDPKFTHRLGEPNVSKAGRKFSNFAEGQWSIQSQAGKAASIEKHIMSLISKLEGKEKHIAELKSRGYRADFFIGVFFSKGNAVFSIKGDVLKSIARLDADVVFDIYG